MKVLITGAFGFCGKHLGAFLSQRGVEVQSMTLQPQLGQHVHLLEQMDASQIGAVLKRAQPDAIFHLAGVTRSQRLSDYYRINVLYAACLLEALSLEGMQKTPTLLVGTAAEYGDVPESQLPLKENNPCSPLDHYGMSKLLQTQLALCQARRGFSVVVVRPFNLIGPGMPSTLALQEFATQLKEIRRGTKGTKMRVGRLDCVRDFVDVRDGVRIYWDILRIPQGIGKIVNVCTGKGLRIGGLLEKLISLSHCSPSIVEEDALSNHSEISASIGCPDLLHQLVGPISWTPLERTLEDILNWE